ncbi:excalibur calcium-binding domain-containing protein [Alkalicoccus saliphilus]|uniref:Uncharacterized protein n=1 Tax=Alkalicoccus saliphilus TaxID=200989 RepID=A0A2T4U5D0_9BACI|nr:excalibur calcium-binding domain-containing protein [Alkalicoccus saliphilus]PTL38611.1 hypothetical protein C6Y45_10530 [Alkalicoccus saliphilus]
MLKKWMIGISSAVIVTFGGMTAVHAEHSDTKNCGDFDTGEEVWEFWTEHGYSSENDPDRLDGDSDGVPCEDLTLSAGLESDFLAYDEDQTGSEDNNNNNNENNNNENNSNEENNYNEANNEDHNENNNNANHEDEENNNAAAGNNDEGDEMAATSTSYPLMALIGIIAAGAGGFMLFGRKKAAQA